MNTAIITGITGQDGYWLSELLCKKGYKVIGISRRTSSGYNRQIRPHLHSDVILESGDITDQGSIKRIIERHSPIDEFYNLAAQSFVGTSWREPVHTTRVNAIGVLNCLESIRDTDPSIRFYQASSSEMFGNAPAPQNEKTPMKPRSPYGAAKLYGYHITKNYRESYDMFASNGILFNHESEYRGLEFVTRKISNFVAKWHAHSHWSILQIGNLDARRDWGHAEDYVRGMHMMLQYDEPDDFVLATNDTLSVREFITEAFKAVGYDIYWQGEGLEEKGYVDGKITVMVKEEFYRPADINILQGDYSKARDTLGWEPKHDARSLAQRMVRKDLERV